MSSGEKMTHGSIAKGGDRTKCKKRAHDSGDWDEIRLKKNRGSKQNRAGGKTKWEHGCW